MDDTASSARAVRRAGLRALPTPTELDLSTDGLQVEPDPPLLDVIDQLRAPRVPELDALLREVDDLRQTLRRDLTLAATAAEAGADDLAGWLLLGQDGAVRRFEARATEQLASAGDTPEVPAPLAVPTPRRPHRRMLPAAPLVAAAAALFGFLTGVVPGGGSGAVTSPQISNTAALDSYAQLTRLATSGASDDSISAAALRFHADLAPLVAAAGSNPAAAEKAIALLQSERVVISAEGNSPALQAVLAEADALVRRLQATLPHAGLVPPTVVPMPQSPPRQQSDTPKRNATPKPSPSPTPKPSPKPSASPTPKPTGSPSPNDPFPAPPGTLIGG